MPAYNWVPSSATFQAIATNDGCLSFCTAPCTFLRLQKVPSGSVETELAVHFVHGYVGPMELLCHVQKSWGVLANLWQMKVKCIKTHNWFLFDNCSRGKAVDGLSHHTVWWGQITTINAKDFTLWSSGHSYIGSVDLVSVSWCHRHVKLVLLILIFFIV